jgi:hypothetical protein
VIKRRVFIPRYAVLDIGNSRVVIGSSYTVERWGSVTTIFRVSIQKALAVIFFDKVIYILDQTRSMVRLIVERFDALCCLS